MLTLTASAIPPEAPLPVGYALRPMDVADIPELGELYFAAYDPGDAAASVAEAREDMQASFAGDYGPLWPAASPVITRGGRIVAAVVVVREANWPDAPTGPFIIEVFTDRDHRRRGLARAALSVAMRVALTEAHGSIGLRVNEDNLGARRLYRELGFTQPAWSSEGIESRRGEELDDRVRQAGPGPDPRDHRGERPSL